MRFDSQKRAGDTLFNFFRLPLSQSYPWTLTVLVDELGAPRVLFCSLDNFSQEQPQAK